MRIEAVVADITTEEVDAIVNAANSTLLGGRGVDGAIHRAAGPGLLDACQKVRDTELPDGLPVGRAVATPGFDLPAAWVIHTVGPNLHAGEDDPALLRACFDSSLELAIQLGCTGIALPAVSAGVYGWPITQVAEIAVARARAVEQRSRTDPDAVGDNPSRPGTTQDGQGRLTRRGTGILSPDARTVPAWRQRHPPGRKTPRT